VRLSLLKRCGHTFASSRQTRTLSTDYARERRRICCRTQMPSRAVQSRRAEEARIKLFPLSCFHDSPNFFLVQKTMQAVVKSRAEPGLWLKEVPIPTVGTDDVLIGVTKTTSCGTDVHRYTCGVWAQETVPAPSTI